MFFRYMPELEWRCVENLNLRGDYRKRILDWIT